MLSDSPTCRPLTTLFVHIILQKTFRDWLSHQLLPIDHVVRSVHHLPGLVCTLWPTMTRVSFKMATKQKLNTFTNVFAQRASAEVINKRQPVLLSRGGCRTNVCCYLTEMILLRIPLAHKYSLTKDCQSIWFCMIAGWWDLSGLR